MKIFLLTAIISWLYSSDIRYEIHKTLAECEVALSAWKDHTVFWPFSGSHNGYCSERQLTEEDIIVYRRRGINW